MKLTRERIMHISKQVMAELDSVEMLDYSIEPNDVRLKVVEVMTHELEIDEVVHKLVVDKMNNKEGSFVIEGTPEWEAEFEQLYQKEMVKHRGFEE